MAPIDGPRQFRQDKDMPILIILLAAFQAMAADAVRPLPRAHAHNDYEHGRPLLDALEQGFGSVEADVHLVKGELLVAHDAEDVQAGRTLAKLYLEPLRERAAKNGGRVYPGGPSIVLLIDLKTEAEATYRQLKEELKRYEEILTRFTTEGIATNAVTVILSGNRPRATLLAEENRLAAFDGRLSDLGQPWPVSFMPLVSDNWRSHFQWRGEGEFSEAERQKLRAIVERVHAEKRMIRFWATPDAQKAWEALRAAGVDLLNTDDLAGLASFLREP